MGVPSCAFMVTSGKHHVSAGFAVQQEVAGPYDAVIIAAPLEHSNIRFEQLDIAHRPKRSYQETVTTYVTGVLQPGYFGVATLPTGLPHTL